MQLRKNWRKLNNQQGSALISVMAIIVFISGVVIGLMYWLWSESKSATQVKAQTKAAYYAEAGVQKALVRLKNDTGLGGLYEDLVTQTTTGDTESFTLVFPGTGTVRVTLTEVP